MTSELVEDWKILAGMQEVVWNYLDLLDFEYFCWRDIDDLTTRVVGVRKGITLWLPIEIVDVVGSLHQWFLWAEIFQLAFCSCMANIATNLVGHIRRDGIHCIYA